MEVVAAGSDGVVLKNDEAIDIGESGATNRDGKVTSADALMILQAAVGKIDL